MLAKVFASNVSSGISRRGLKDYVGLDPITATIRRRISRRGLKVKYATAGIMAARSPNLKKRIERLTEPRIFIDNIGSGCESQEED